MLPSGVDAAMLESIWSSLAAGNGLGAVLESLTGAFGTSLRSIPPFAVATVSGTEVRLAVRGELAIEVAEAADESPLIVSGADVTTWSERVVSAADSVTLRAPAAGADTNADWFPIASGVVLAAAVTLSLTDAAAPAPSSPPTRVTPAQSPADVTPGDGADAASAAIETASTGAGATAATGGAPTAAPPSGAAPEETILPEEFLDPTPPLDDAAGDAERAQTHDDSVDSAEPEAAEELEYTRDELPDDAYDHLWGATVVKSVEEAAVRDLDDEQEDEEAAHPAPASTPSGAAGADSATASGSSDASAGPAADSPSGPAAGFAPPNSPPTAAPQAASSGLIDGIPDFGGLCASSTSASLVGQTVPPAPAASPAPPTPAAPTPTPTAGDDHDGLTVTVSELEAMRRLGAAQAAAPAAPAGSLGRIVLNTGETHTLDRPVIIGRRPRANRVQADQVPVLVTVASPEQDISRNHLEVRLEGRHVLVVDLATTNGSVLHREGTPPLRLGPNEPVLVLSGDIVDIGDGVTVAFEEIV
jgi:hypothetical protein